MAEVVRLKFGVLGGGSVAAGSGAEILRDLKSIVSQIESSGITKLKFKIDTSGITKDIQKQITSAQSVSTKNTIPFSLSNVAKESTRAMSASTAELTRAKVATQNIKAETAKLVGQKQVETAAHKANVAALAEETAKTRQAEASVKKKAAADKKEETQLRQSINTETQNIKVLNQAIRTYKKYEQSIKRVSKEKGLSLDDDFKSFIGKMQANPEYGNTLEARNELAKLEKAMLEAGATSETTLEKLKRLFDAHLSTAIAMVGVHLLQRSIREMYQNVVELDSALVDLQIATGYTREQTRGLISDYSELGQQLGATTLEVAKASDAWLRQGFSVDETNTLIKNSMMLSKLGQIESEEATKALTSAMRGYGTEVEDVVGIVDKLVAVDMNAAVSAGDIATAMAKTATSARLAGIDMNTLIGYISVVSEVTQSGAEEVGNFYKTLFARMGNIKEGHLIDPETGENLGSVETALDAVGIKLRETNGEFRDFDKVLADVAANWDNYGSVQQRALAVAFSGKRIA